MQEEEKRVREDRRGRDFEASRTTVPRKPDPTYSPPESLLRPKVRGTWLQTAFQVLQVLQEAFETRGHVHERIKGRLSEYFGDTWGASE